MIWDAIEHDLAGLGCCQVTFLSKLLSGPDEVIVDNPNKAIASRITLGGPAASGGHLFHRPLPVINVAMS